MINKNLIPKAFILSLNRSGSTLLSSILNAHSEVIGLPESSFILNLAIHFRKANYSSDDYEQIVSSLWIRMNAFEKVWKLDKFTIVQKLQKEQPKQIAEIIQKIQQQYSSKDNHRWIIDKNPIYNHFIRLLDQTFEGNKKIILVRDYRDRFHSLTNEKHKVAYFKRLFHHFSWKIQMKEYVRIKENNPNDVLFVRFEDLICSTRETIEKICNFLDIEFEENMIQNRIANLPDFSTNDELSAKHLRTRQEFDFKQLNKSEFIALKDLKSLHLFNSELGKLFGYSSVMKLTAIEKTIIYLNHLPVLLIYRLFFLAIKLSYYLPLSVQKRLAK